jgi:hypothetical protein
VWPPGASIVERTAGVQARSEGPGKGSEFIVRLPLSHEPLTPPNESAEQPADAGTLRVLVVDDNVDAADSLAVLLQQLGHRVETAMTAPRQFAPCRPSHHTWRCSTSACRTCPATTSRAPLAA